MESNTCDTPSHPSQTTVVKPSSKKARSKSQDFLLKAVSRSFLEARCEVKWWGKLVLPRNNILGPCISSHWAILSLHIPHTVSHGFHKQTPVENISCSSSHWSFGDFWKAEAVCQRLRGKSTNNLVGRPLETLSLISCATQSRNSVRCIASLRERKGIAFLLAFLSRDAVWVKIKRAYSNGNKPRLYYP